MVYENDALVLYNSETLSFNLFLTSEEGKYPISHDDICQKRFHPIELLKARLLTNQKPNYSILKHFASRVLLYILLLSDQAFNLQLINDRSRQLYGYCIIYILIIDIYC